jgi:arsenate reductase (glutaredoxin)
MVKVFGIRNCDTVRKAVNWLNNNSIKVEFFDFKVTQITSEKMFEWADQVGWELLLNKKGTTWRRLDKSVQEKITNKESAVALLIQKPSMIKRPVLEISNKLRLLGFNEKEYEHEFLGKS